jgi:ribosomal protein S18 acetylase RimI-like enzyme
MTEALTYRPADIDDVPAMARLRELSGWTGGADAERMRRYLLGEHHPQQARRPRVVVVAESATLPVGFIAGHLTTRFGCAGELQWILVDPEQRGRDVGTELLRHLAEWFRKEGVARVCVNVAPDNEQARRFYLRHGALSLSEHWMEWLDIALVLTPRR